MSKSIDIKEHLNHSDEGRQTRSCWVSGNPYLMLCWMVCCLFWAKLCFFVRGQPSSISYSLFQFLIAFSGGTDNADSLAYFSIFFSAYSPHSMFYPSDYLLDFCLIQYADQSVFGPFWHRSFYFAVRVSSDANDFSS